MDSFEYFVKYILPGLILGLGLFGNSLGFKVMERPKMLEIGPRNAYKYLFIMDTIYLLQLIVTNLQLSYQIDITLISNISCKLWNYLNYSLDTQSSMLLVYISIDRYVSIKIPALRFFMRKRNNQLIYFVFIFMFNLIYYLPVCYNYVLVTANETSYCIFYNQFSQDLLSYMDLANRVILPSILILISSILLGIEVIKSKNRILTNFEKEENEYFFNNISLAITSICLNILYVLAQTPISIYTLLPSYTQIYGYVLSYYLFYSSYSINFYVLILSNSLFRKEFILFVRNFLKNFMK
jgi:hypothetical protein